ncbi:MULTISPECIES: hypothetical protein [unclassified Streptomyces]|uniref:hypothetical protein n=1 Tax=unclassified Streptomyces TaxID=2593676 RepID=UPI0018EEC068|nr:hypothetical protein [Streptomyces sp. DHE7-1]
MRARHLARLGGLIATPLLLAACATHDPGTAEASRAPMPTMGSAVGEKLTAGIEGARKAGLGVTFIDTTDRHRSIDLDSAARYTICSQRPDPAMRAVKFYVVPSSSRCPSGTGGAG